jgi:light-regulated signal transduction histidine kinase (bacteriophytochrome)
MQTDNGTAVDLTNCDREPIHLLGSVQPFGFLLAVSSTTWCVTRTSRNVVEWLGVETADLLVTSGPLGDRLTPRKSFELWRETVRGQSSNWLAVECRIAEALRVSLLEVILRLSDLTESERRRAQERQELLIATIASATFWD